MKLLRDDKLGLSGNAEDKDEDEGLLRRRTVACLEQDTPKNNWAVGFGSMKYCNWDVVQCSCNCEFAFYNN